jgi:hypothetical protein
MTEAQSPAPNETPSVAPEPRSRSRVRELVFSHADRVLAVLGALVFALSYGFDYGSDNQLIYLLKSLCIATPGILERDWYAAEVTHYHPVFAYLGAALIALNRDGWAVALAQIALITTGMSYVYELLRALSTKRVALAAFFCTLSIASVTRTSGVAVSYVFDSLLQPSALGSLGLLAALAEFVRGRYLASGIWIGIAGLFHANYLVLAIPTFGLMQLLLGLRGLFPRLLRQLGPLMIAAIPVLPVMISTASSPDAERARDILFSIRSPHHYSPGSFYKGLAPFAGWQMLGLGLGAALFRGRNTAGRRLGIALASLMVLVWVGSAFSTVVYVPRVVQLFVWRFAPYIDLLCAAVACLVLVRVASEPGFARRLSPPMLALALGGLVVIGTFQTERKNPFGLVLTFVLVALAVWGLSELGRFAPRFALSQRAGLLWRAHGATLVLLLGLVQLGRALPEQLAELPARSLLLRQDGPKSDELYAWMREKTPREAVFLTPPDVDSFRFYGQRAIVVDWKSTPMVPGELVEWLRRLRDVCGGPVESRRDLRGYDELDREQLERLKAKYRIDYAVVRRGAERKLGYESVFRNQRYSVIRL